MEAHALISVPSTEKCSSDSSGLTSDWARTAAMNLRDISVVSRRSRFFVNPDWIVDAKAHEPAEQEIIPHLLHELPLRASRKQYLDQARADYRFRRDGGAAMNRVEPVELGIEAEQGVIDDLPDLAERVLGGNSILEVDVA